MTRVSTPILEVIACSVADAKAAAEGGADRLELVRDLARGGLTPLLDVVREIVAAVALPVRVMVREVEDFTVTDEVIVEKLCRTAQEFAALPLDGLVLGFVRQEAVDLALTERVLASAPHLKATFHHAFEATARPLESIAQLKSCPAIDRILTYGGTGNWTAKINRLAAYERAAQPELTILVGGGLDLAVIRSLRRATTIHEFHVGRAVRQPAAPDGIVQASLVREVVAALRENS